MTTIGIRIILPEQKQKHHQFPQKHHPPLYSDGIYGYRFVLYGVVLCFIIYLVMNQYSICHHVVGMMVMVMMVIMVMMVMVMVIMMVNLTRHCWWNTIVSIFGNDEVYY